MYIATTNPIVKNALKACNIQTRYEIEYGNGKKDYVEAYSEEDAKKKRKVMASVYGGFKSVKAENAATAAEPVAKNGNANDHGLGRCLSRAIDNLQEAVKALYKIGAKNDYSIAGKLNKALDLVNEVKNTTLVV